jgi:hypothetical protein
MLFSPFLITIVTIIATDNPHLPFGFVSGAKAQRADSNKVVAFRDALHDITMPVLAMNDVIFPRPYGSGESHQNAKR